MKKRLIYLIIVLINARLFSQIYFNSPEEAVNYALSRVQNYSLNLQHAQIALKGASIAINEFLPTLDFSLSEDDSISMQSSDSRSKSISFNVNETIFDGGKRLITYKMNKAEKYFDLKNAEQSLDSFRSAVLNQYYNCVLQKTYLEIKTELENNTKTQLDIMKKESELGIALETDYLEYLISYRKIQDEKRQVERELRSQYRVLKVLIGLDPETDIDLAKPEYDSINYDLYLEPHIKELWEIVKQNNPTIKKNDIALFYQQQQYEYNRRIYVPELTLQFGVSFSGNVYPLNSPKYTAKIGINFSNFPFLPVSLSNSYGFNKDNLTSVNNAASTSLSGTPDYFYNWKNGSVEMLQKMQSVEDERNSMYENFFGQIAAYDDSLDSIQRLEETIELENRRIEISKKQVEKGDMKRIDFLNALIELSELQIQLEQSKIDIFSTIRNLEIVLCIPYGGIEKCINE